MGRHSIPDPEDSAGEEQQEDPATPRFEEQEYDTSQYREAAPESFTHDEPDYGRTEYEDDPAAFDLRRVGSSSPPPDRPRSGPQHGGDWEGGEWTGSHRAVTTGRRGVSIGVIAALVTVIVVVAAVILWRFFGDALSSRSDAAAARCVNGELAVAVVADPSIADQIKTLADDYNRDAAPVGDRCMKVGVTPADSDQVVNGFVGQWPADLGERPALWIPASSISTARLEASAGEKTISDSRSLVNSPVVLAIRPELKAALAQQNWATLPAMQTNPNALDGLGLPGWGSLRLALPLSGDSDASYLAAEAVAVSSAPARSPAHFRHRRGELAGGGPAQAGRQQGLYRDGRSARRPRSGRRAGACGRHHRAAALPARRGTARREEGADLLAATRACGDRGLSDSPAGR